METKPENEYSLYIPYDSYVHLFSYVHAIDKEIGGFADITYSEVTKMFTMGNVYLLKQEVTGASVDISEENMSQFMTERIKAGATQLPQLSWHSHVDMDTFFSTTDDKAYSDELKNQTYFISIVVNKKGDILGQLNVYKPFQCIIPLDVVYDDFPEIPKAILDEVADKVTTPVTAYTYSYPDKDKKGVIAPVVHSTEGMAVDGLIEEDGSIILWGTKYKDWEMLPLGFHDAKELIEKNHLMRRYHANSGSFVFVNDITNELYVDHWDRFNDYEYSQR